MVPCKTVEKRHDMLGGDRAEFGLYLILSEPWVVFFFAFGNSKLFEVGQFSEVFEDT